MVGDSYTGQSFRMKSLSSASRERVRKGNTAEGPKKYDGEYEEGEDENTRFLEESDRKSTRLNSSHSEISRMPSSA